MFNFNKLKEIIKNFFKKIPLRLLYIFIFPYILNHNAIENFVPTIFNPYIRKLIGLLIFYLLIDIILSFGRQIFNKVWYLLKKSKIYIWFFPLKKEKITFSYYNLFTFDTSNGSDLIKLAEKIRKIQEKLELLNTSLANINPKYKVRSTLLIINIVILTGIFLYMCIKYKRKINKRKEK
jgi:hypothetical protein